MLFLSYCLRLSSASFGDSTAEIYPRKVLGLCPTHSWGLKAAYLLLHSSKAGMVARLKRISLACHRPTMSELPHDRKIELENQTSKVETRT